MKLPRHRFIRDSRLELRNSGQDRAFTRLENPKIRSGTRTARRKKMDLVEGVQFPTPGEEAEASNANGNVGVTKLHPPEKAPCLDLSTPPSTLFTETCRASYQNRCSFKWPKECDQVQSRF